MIVILAGTNTFLIRQELEKLVRPFVAEQGDLALERLDGDTVEFDRAREAVASLPFLASKKMVILRGGSANKNLGEHITELLDSVNDTTDLIIVEGKLDKRSVYYKTLKAQKGFKEFNEPDEQALVNWLRTTATEQGGELSVGDARLLFE
jgi:DNA polymerase III delta subunit